MGVTAKARAGTALTGTTAMPPAEVFNLLRSMAGSVKGGGASLLTTGITNLGAMVNVVRTTESTMVFSLTSGKRLVELCTFSATASVGLDGRTRLRIGGLETFKTQQSKFLFVIPAGPKQIYGMAPYKRFLAATAAEIQARDGSAAITVAQPQG